MIRVVVLTAMLVATTAYETHAYWHHILRFYSWSLSTWDNTLVAWTLAAKTLLLVSPVVVAGAWVGSRHKTLFALTLRWLAPIAVMAYLIIDVKIQTMTGEHLAYYLRRAVSRHAIGWAGDPSRFLPLLVPLVLAAALTIGVFWLARGRGWLDEPAGDTTPSRWSRRCQWLIALAACGIVPARMLAHQPAALERLHAALPITMIVFQPRWMADHGFSTFGANTDDRFVPLGERLFALSGQSQRLGAIDWVAASPTQRPHVVILILESFRHDSVTPALMPRLHRWAESAMTCENHSSTSNCSPQGSFAILHGQVALAYDAVLDTGADAMWCALARRAGYQTHLAAACDFGYRRMDEMFAQPDFDSVELFARPRDQWPDADAASLRRLTEILNEASTPQMVVGYLMTTHFDYPSPTAYAAIRCPDDELRSSPRGDTAAADLRDAYTRSLRSIDETLGDFLDPLDPENTLVIVTGDHGESLLDDGLMAHGSRLSKIQTRTPLLIRGPGMDAIRRTTMTSHVDLLPTWLDLLGVDAVPALHGRSLLHADRGDRIDPVRLLVQEYPDTWDVALESEAADRTLLLNLDRRSGGFRVIGFLDDDGIVDASLKQDPSQATIWANRLNQWLTARDL